MFQHVLHLLARVKNKPLKINNWKQGLVIIGQYRIVVEVYLTRGGYYFKLWRTKNTPIKFYKLLLNSRMAKIR